MDTTDTYNHRPPRPTFDETHVATFARRFGSRLDVSVRRRHVDGAECVALQHRSREGRSTTMMVFPHELAALAAALAEANTHLRGLPNARDRRRP